MSSFQIVWMDSLGAKSMSVLVETPDVNILIDPGAAIMHPSFPASDKLKLRWLREAKNRIREVAPRADIVVISHYHYDHFTDFDLEIYRGKTLFVKNPNEYINDSQRKRAEKFFMHLCEALDYRFEEILLEPVTREWTDPFEELEIASSRDYGDYNDRKKELLEKGREWFRKRTEKWTSYPYIPELDLGEVFVRFPEGKVFNFGSTKLRFTRPLFHGIEYSRLGWVFATIVEHGKWKLIHTSDINGPIIEDYADWIIREDPDILVLDGPMTYMLGYTLNLINLRRAVENAVRIVEETDCKVIIYDHHLPREPRFREHTAPVWETAERLGKKVMTAAEFLGMKPVVLGE